MFSANHFFAIRPLTRKNETQMESPSVALGICQLQLGRLERVSYKLCTCQDN